MKKGLPPFFSRRRKIIAINMRCRKSLISGSVFIAFLVLIPLGKSEADDNFSLNENKVVSQLIENSATMMRYECIDPATKKQIAYGLYGILFQCWMIPQFKGSTILSHETIGLILSSSKSYVAANDPLELEPYYKNDNLEGIGLMRARFFLILNNADVVFKSQKEYERKVRLFQSWLSSKH